MLRLERVALTYGTWRLTADLTFPADSTTALIGPSGAGKSTLLAAIAGFEPPTEGRILWDATDLTPLPPGARPLTLVFQEHNLFGQLTVAENVGLGLRPDLRLLPPDRERVRAALAEVGLADKAGRRPAALSGGERSRVALARALLRDRPILMLDEPFSALGPALRDEMLDLVARIRAAASATLLLVSHDPADLRRIADQVVLVDAGRADPPVATDALFADPPPALRSYLGSRRAEREADP